MKKFLFIQGLILVLIGSLTQLEAKSHPSSNGFITIVLNDNPIPGTGISQLNIPDQSPEQILTKLGVIDPLINTLNTAIPRSVIDSVSGSFTYFADAQSAATRGLGTTYATNHTLFIISASANVGASTGTKTVMDVIQNPNGLIPAFSQGKISLPQLGAGAQASAVFGLSFRDLSKGGSSGFLDISRLNLFVNYFMISNKVLGLNIPMGAIQPEIKMDSFGLHAQYKIIEGKSVAASALNWGGLDLTSGIDIATNSINLPLGTLFNQLPSFSGLNLKAGNIGFVNTAFTVPIEVSTSVRIGYILSLIAGGGVDINMGNAAFVIDPIKLGGQVPTLSGKKTVDFGEIQFSKIKKDATFADVRFFIGPQINLVPVANGKNVISISVLASVSTVNLYGVHVGVNIGF